MKNVKAVSGKAISFIAADDREMFEVTIGKDGVSLEIRSVDNCKVNGVLYSTQLTIEPKVSNSIVIRCLPYPA